MHCMSRPLRIQYEGAIYHVMNRGTNRLPIFYSDNHKSMFLHVLAQAVEQYQIRIHAYSLMNNHYHLLLETPLANLSRAMRHIDGVYTQIFNRMTERDGPLFRGRFKSILVQRETYFLALVRYIHMNPVKAKLCLRASDHYYTSHRAYLYPNQRPPWLTVSTVLSRWGRDEYSTHQQLDEFVHAPVGEKLREQMEGLKWPAVLGGSSFLAAARALLPSDDGTERSEKPQEKQLRYLVKPESVMSAVESIYNISLAAPIERRNGRALIARTMAMHALRCLCQLTCVEIGKLMGGLGYGAVSTTLRKKPADPEKMTLISEMVVSDCKNET